MKLLATRISASIEQAGHLPGLAEPANQLAAALQALGAATQAAWSTGIPDEAMPNATTYLQAFGQTVLARLSVAAARNPTCRDMRDDWF